MFGPPGTAAGAVVLVPRAVEPHLELVRSGGHRRVELEDRRVACPGSMSVTTHASSQSAAQPELAHQRAHQGDRWSGNARVIGGRQAGERRRRGRGPRPSAARQSGRRVRVIGARARMSGLLGTERVPCRKPSRKLPTRADRQPARLSGPAAPGPRPRPARPTRTTLPSAPKTRNRSKPRANQRSWVTATTVPSKAAEPVLQRLGRLHVEVVGRLVEQQQRGAGQLEQQDLQPRLLAAGQRVEALLGGLRQLVAVAAPGTPARRPIPSRCSSPRPQDVEQRAAHAARGGRGSGRTSPGRTRAPSRAVPVCATGRSRRPRPAGARRRGRCRRARAAAGSATCPSRWSRARRPARRTRPPGRTASSAR